MVLEKQLCINSITLLYPQQQHPQCRCSLLLAISVQPKSSTEPRKLSNVHWLKQKEICVLTFCSSQNKCLLAAQCKPQPNVHTYICYSSAVRLQRNTNELHNSAKADLNANENQTTCRGITSFQKNPLISKTKMMFQSVSLYPLKAFELNNSKYQLMKEDLSKKVCANIVILPSEF